MSNPHEASSSKTVHQLAYSGLKSHISTSFIEVEHELQGKVIDLTIDYYPDGPVPPENMAAVLQCEHALKVLRELRLSLLGTLECH